MVSSPAEGIQSLRELAMEAICTETTREVVLTKGLVAVVDESDWCRDLTCGFKDGFAWHGRLCDMRWFLFQQDHTNYCLAFIGKSQRRLRLHRAILCAGGEQVVDHRDGNGLNNVRSNLRFATHRQNRQNRKANVNRISAFKGVSPCGVNWRARIKHSGTTTCLGTYLTEEEAGRAYDDAAIRLFGEFARLNFPKVPA